MRPRWCWCCRTTRKPQAAGAPFLNGTPGIFPRLGRRGPAINAGQRKKAGELDGERRTANGDRCTLKVSAAHSFPPLRSREALVVSSVLCRLVRRLTCHTLKRIWHSLCIFQAMDLAYNFAVVSISVSHNGYSTRVIVWTVGLHFYVNLVQC